MSYDAYDGKDCIKLVRKLNVPHAVEHQLQKLRVQAVSLVELLSSASTAHRPLQNLSFDESEAQYSHQLTAAKKIQKFWRSHYPRLLAKRAFFETPVGGIYVDVLELCKQNAASRTMRFLFIAYAVGFLEKIRRLSDTAYKLQQKAVDLVIGLPQGSFERIDEVIQRVSSILESVENAAKTVSMDRLKQLVKEEPSEVLQLFKSADAGLEGVSSDLLEAQKMMETVQGADDM